MLLTLAFACPDARVSNQIMTVTVDAINAIKQQADAFGNMRVSEGFDILLRTWNRLFDSADSPRCACSGLRVADSAEVSLKRACPSRR